MWVGFCVCVCFCFCFFTDSRHCTRNIWSSSDSDAVAYCYFASLKTKKPHRRFDVTMLHLIRGQTVDFGIVQITHSDFDNSVFCLCLWYADMLHALLALQIWCEMIDEMISCNWLHTLMTDDFLFVLILTAKYRPVYVSMHSACDWGPLGSWVNTFSRALFRSSKSLA